MNCKRCNRKLKSLDSISIGYGPYCARLSKIKIIKKEVVKYKGENILKWTK